MFTLVVVLAVSLMGQKVGDQNLYKRGFESVASCEEFFVSSRSQDAIAAEVEEVKEDLSQLGAVDVQISHTCQEQH